MSLPTLNFLRGRRGVSNVVSAILLTAITATTLAAVMAAVEWQAKEASADLPTIVDQRIRRAAALLSVVSVEPSSNAMKVYIFNYGLHSAEIEAILVNGVKREFSVLDDGLQPTEPYVPPGSLRVLVISGSVESGATVSVIVNGGRVVSFSA